MSVRSQRLNISLVICEKTCLFAQFLFLPGEEDMQQLGSVCFQLILLKFQEVLILGQGRAH